MGPYIADQVVRLMAKRGVSLVGARVLILGLTFKENCPDVRNTRVVDIVRELRQYHVHVDVHDPWIDPAEALHEYGIAHGRDAAGRQLRRGDPGGRAPAVRGARRCGRARLRPRRSRSCTT